MPGRYTVRLSANAFIRVHAMHSSRQRLLLLIAAFCFAAVGLALVSQHVYDMPPCAWCVLQRLIYLAIGVVAMVGACAWAIARACSACCPLLGGGGLAARGPGGG